MNTNHGVSGYPCLGVAGEFQEQRRGEPWEAIINDPIRSYMNAQSHIGIPLSNFNEPWTGGTLQDLNFSSQPYRTAVFGESAEVPPPSEMGAFKTSDINYPDQVGNVHPQQLPSSRVHNEGRLPLMDRQNLGWEGSAQSMYRTGDNRSVVDPRNVYVQPNVVNFQGASTATGVHPNNDTANQQTAANTSRTDFVGGQGPTSKLPQSITIGSMQPNEPPGLWELAPPPDPPVLPGEGTAPLQPTNPAWW